MSLTVSLLMDYCEHCQKGETVFTENITHNLTEMADALGIYYEIWRPEEKNIKFARELILVLDKAIDELITNEKKYKKFNPKNGWGSYWGFLKFLETYLKNCKAYPDSVIEICR